MKTLKTITALGLASVILAFTPSTKKETLTIKPEASKVEWFAEKVTGAHNGLIDLKKGAIVLEDGALTSGEFVIDMKSIQVTDISGDSQKKLEGHLKSEDFFAVDNFGEARFEITEVKNQTEGTFNTSIAGNLTIKGKTHPVEFPAKVEVKDGNFAAYGEMTIDRTKYDIRYGSNSFFDNLGDRAIYDEFVIKVSIGAQI